MPNYRVFLKNKGTGDFGGFSQVKTITAKDEEEAKQEAMKLESGGWKIYKIEKSG